MKIWEYMVISSTNRYLPKDGLFEGPENINPGDIVDINGNDYQVIQVFVSGDKISVQGPVYNMDKAGED